MKVDKHKYNLVPGNSDNELFKGLYRRYHKGLCLFALKFMVDIQCAQDLVQEVFLSLWENRVNFNFSDLKEMEAYLYRSVRNNCVTYLKRDNTRKKHRNNILLDLINDKSFQDNQTNATELEEKIDFILDQLPDKTKTIFKLSRVEGLTNKQVAKKLQVSEKNIEYHISKTLKIFRDKLVEYVSVIVIFISMIKL